jgi:hypothetical protein
MFSSLFAAKVQNSTLLKAQYQFASNEADVFPVEEDYVTYIY